MNEQTTPFLTFAKNVKFAASEPDWLQSLRVDGVEQYTKLGLPNIKLEDWKYTNIQSLSETSFRTTSASDRDIHVDSTSDIDSAFRMVMVNGYFREDLSDISTLPTGVTLVPLETALANQSDWLEKKMGKYNYTEARALIALNIAAANTGFFLHLQEGVIVDGIIEIISLNRFVGEAVAMFPRNLIVLEEGAQVCVSTSHGGSAEGEYLSNCVTEVNVAQNAHLNLVSMQEDSEKATHISSTIASVAKDAVFESFTLSMGGRLTRNETRVMLVGSGAECKLDGAYLMRGHQHCDNTTYIAHKAPDTCSDEMFKGVLDEEARGVFQGKIFVERDAQRIDGQMQNKTILLSDKAEVDTKPELEIYANDVKCTHGAASGQIDEAALFYLCSRGIPESHARNLLIRSFMDQVVNRIKDKTLRDCVSYKIAHWLPAMSSCQQERRIG